VLGAAPSIFARSGTTRGTPGLLGRNVAGTLCRYGCNVSRPTESGVRTREASIGPFALAAVALAVGVTDIPVSIAVHDSASDVLPTWVMTLALIASGVVVARRQPRNAIGWLLLVSGLFFALNGLASDYSVLDYRNHHGSLPLGPVAVVLQPSWAPAIVCFALSILLFPAGRVPGRRWRWGLWAFLALCIAWQGGAFSIALRAIATGQVHVNAGGDLVAIDDPTGGNAWWGYVQDAFFPVAALSALAWLGRQLVVLRRARDIERLQLKWFTSGALLSLIGGAASIAAPGTGVGKQIATVLSVGLVAFPISIAVAIARYHLYDIDRILSRTITYAVLTALLAGTFIGVVVLTTDVLPLSSRISVAASTLVAATLFNPLRIRVQQLVDRRFNRSRYDAEAIAGAFGARLRDAVDIDTIRRDLLDSVNHAVQPAHASLWIKP
jgi:hypothetical protein